MQIEANKTYLTSGGYVVAIVKGDGGSLQLLSTIETSPGIMYSGKNVYETNAGLLVDTNKHLGWYYSEKGECESVSNEWRIKLQITEELPFSLPTLPSGYRWKGDFPQYRAPVVGEEFLGQNKVAGGGRCLDGSVVKCCKFWLSGAAGERRLIVEPIAKDLTEAGKYKLLGSGDQFVVGVSECDSKGTFQKCTSSGNVSDYMKYNFRHPVPVSTIPAGMVEVTQFPDYILKRNGDGYLVNGTLFTFVKDLTGDRELSVQWFIDISPTDYKLYATQENYAKWAKDALELERKKVVDTYKIGRMEVVKVKLSEGETSTVGEQIKKERDYIEAHNAIFRQGQGFDWVRPAQLTVRNGSVPTLRQRALSYWVVDPIRTIAKEVKTALPYVVLGGSVWGIVHSVFHYEEIKDLYHKHVPSISISIDAPEIFKDNPSSFKE